MSTTESDLKLGPASSSSTIEKVKHERLEHHRGLDAINEFDEDVVIVEGEEKVHLLTLNLGNRNYFSNHCGFLRSTAIPGICYWLLASVVCSSVGATIRV
jgi:hypothetical protein